MPNTAVYYTTIFSTIFDTIVLLYAWILVFIWIYKNIYIKNLIKNKKKLPKNVENISFIDWIEQIAWKLTWETTTYKIEFILLKWLLWKIDIKTSFIVAFLLWWNNVEFKKIFYILWLFLLVLWNVMVLLKIIYLNYYVNT